ncbi:hypothetical protein, partial [Salmonella enterica]|uniref:hypothetical protein n=1 Tax=Salmonella enterica TaxID=28901 RepID=UPI003524A33E
AAPSESIQRKKSFLKANTGCSSKAFKLIISFEYLFESIRVEINSDPTQTALLVLPDLIDKNANFKAFIPEQQMPEDEFNSNDLFFNKPCTMAACEGAIKSGDEVPQES